MRNRCYSHPYPSFRVSLRVCVCIVQTYRLSESRTTTSALFFQPFWPSVQRFNKWPSWAHSLTAYCPMNRDAYLTGSSSLQHLCYKTALLLSYSVTLRCRSECTDSLDYMHHWIIHSTSDTATNDNEGWSSPVSLFFQAVRWALLKSHTFLSLSDLSNNHYLL